MNETSQLKLHDIKDIVSIPDNSIFIFSLLIFLLLLIIIAIAFFIIKLIKNKKVNERKIYFEKLKEIDYTNTKESAYTITKAIRFLAQSDREKKLAYEIIEDLEKYKYKKDVQDIDNDTKAKVTTFMDVLDV